ncbi:MULTISPECIES: hypothetical protein [unclassified Mesorhizobium]|uniref:hypothetical protein n=1 Tax=unclassified Mesorhizobium TaxID=325217 RepID=UPI003014A0DB
MRLSVASLALGLLLCVTVAGKVVSLARTPDVASDEGAAAVALMNMRGLAVQPFNPVGAPAWIVGTLDDCRVRIAEVAPEGWSRAIVAQQATNERLLYAFDGRFYDQQPVTSTWIENYRRRLARYIGFEEPALRLFAVTVAPACPADIVRPEDAIALTQ